MKMNESTVDNDIYKLHALVFVWMVMSDENAKQNVWRTPTLLNKGTNTHSYIYPSEIWIQAYWCSRKDIKNEGQKFTSSLPYGTKLAATKRCKKPEKCGNRNPSYLQLT